MSRLSSKIGLGSAQWGMRYGAVNTTGQASAKEIKKFLAIAKESGINLIDTSPLYGNAENRLGECDLSSLSVITKSPHFKSSCITSQNAETLRISLLDSQRHLQENKIYGLLIHDADDLLKTGGSILAKELNRLKTEGLVQRVGVSIYCARQIREITEFFIPDIVQAPISVFDQRLIQDGTLASLNSAGIEIHARSVLLQGILAAEYSSLPNYFRPWKAQIASWHSFCKSKNIQPAEAATAFVCRLSEVSHCIMGFETADQLIEILNSLEESPSFDASPFSAQDARLLDPRNWKL